jgi:branched-chain amino acid aminotransferase
VLSDKNNREVKMIKDRIVYLNGEYVPWENATVHIMCHSFGRGSAIFEVISFRLQAHIDRLFRSAELLDMELPLSKEDFFEAITETVKRNGLQKGYLKIICFYPEFSVELLPPQKKLTVSIFVIDAEQDLGKKIIPYEEGTTLFLSSWRKLDPLTVPIEAKAAANYLNGMVARKEAQKKGFEYAVMLDTQGYIAEGGTESAFLVKDNKLMTAATGTVLKSISRMSILEAAKIAGIECFEGQLKPELLFEADEIFLSCTPSKVLPVLKINDRELEHAPGPLTQKIAEMLDGIYSGDDERFKDWMYPVL